MYSLSKVISNDTALNLIPEISFTPDGSVFAVTHLKTNELVIFDSLTRSVLRVLSNPDALLDGPHGIVMTNKHIVVSNIRGTTRPSSFNVYSLTSSYDAPVSVYETPYRHLREAHTLTIHNTVLAVAYCHSAKGRGALLTYDFDDEAGLITGPIATRDSCFPGAAESKSVAFSTDGSRVFVTYVSEHRVTGLPRYLRLLRDVRMAWKERGGVAASRQLLTRISTFLARGRATPSAIENGIAIFDVSDKGVPSEEPVMILRRKAFCRLESIATSGDTVIIVDAINSRVCLHDLVRDPRLEFPIDTITDSLNLPHGAKLSPDNRMLVVTDFGLKMEHQDIHWTTPSATHANRILVYDLNP